MVLEVPTISVVFDDNSPTIYTEGFIRMQQLDMVGCIYVITANINGSGLITSSQLQEMYDAGWDVSNHTSHHTNLSTIDATAIAEQFFGGRDRLVQSGREWYRSSESFVYPFNAFTELSQSIIEPNVNYCTAESSSEGLYNTYPMADLLHIQRAAVGTNSVQSVKGFVDYTIANNVYTHLYFHAIDEPIGYNYPPSMFQEVIDYIAEKRDSGLLRVVTHSQLVREHNPTTLTIKTS